MHKLNNDNAMANISPLGAQMTHPDLTLLYTSINDGTISADTLKLGLDMLKKDKVLTVHRRKISEPNNKQGLYQTRIVNGKGEIEKVRAKTEAEFYKKLYNFYFAPSERTLTTLYPDWLDKRKAENVADRTIRRNKDYWSKYYMKHKIANMPLHELSVVAIENYFNDVIREHNLTKKELNNMKFVLTDMLKLAKRKQFIIINPFNTDDIEIKREGCRTPKKMKDNSRVYIPEEKQNLFAVMSDEITNNPNNIDILAISLLFRWGLRIGELVALCWSDIDYEDKTVHIHKMESKIYDDNDNEVVVVVPHVKGKNPYADRFIDLDDYDFALLNQIKNINKSTGQQSDDYIFCDWSGRRKSRNVDKTIRKMCKRAGIAPAKSAHDIRRTVASEMYANGVPVEMIREFMGHSDIKQTYEYIVNFQAKKETRNKILEAKKDLCGLVSTGVHF